MKWLEMDAEAYEAQLSLDRAFDRAMKMYQHSPRALSYAFALCDLAKKHPAYLLQLKQLFQDIEPLKKLDIEHCLVGRGGRELPPMIRHISPRLQDYGGGIGAGGKGMNHIFIIVPSK